MLYCVFYYDRRFKNYYVYYNDGRYIESQNFELNCNRFEFSRLTKSSIKNQLELGITLKDILKAHCDKYQIWRDELNNDDNRKQNIVKYDFFKTFEKSDFSIFYQTNESNILQFFNMYSSRKYKNDTFDKITWNEYLWYEKTCNGGLMSCIKGDFQTIGRDFKLSYPTILASQLIIDGKRQFFHFPIKKGKRIKLKSFKDKLKYGIYHVKIMSDNVDFGTAFQFNTNNYYTHYDIAFCLEFQKEYNITIELIKDGEFNALIYTNEKLIDGSEVFGYWYKKIIELRKQYPNNGLVKLMSSSIWGYLSKINKKFYTIADIQNEENNINFDYHDTKETNYLCIDENENIKTGETEYLLINKEQPYTRNFRLKPFITSFQRIVLSKIILEIGINKVVKVNTDNITFNEKLLTDEDKIKISKISPTFIIDDATTGNFKVHNIFKFERL